MNPVFNMDAASLSPVALFIHADWVVKIVMIGLLLASIWTWTIIVAFSRKLARTKKGMTRFERDFWKAEDIDASTGWSRTMNCPPRGSFRRACRNGGARPRAGISTATARASASPPRWDRPWRVRSTSCRTG